MSHTAARHVVLNLVLNTRNNAAIFRRCTVTSFSGMPSCTRLRERDWCERLLRGAEAHHATPAVLWRGPHRSCCPCLNTAPIDCVLQLLAPSQQDCASGPCTKTLSRPCDERCTAPGPGANGREAYMIGRSPTHIQKRRKRPTHRIVRSGPRNTCCQIHPPPVDCPQGSSLAASRCRAQL